MNNFKHQIILLFCLGMMFQPDSATAQINLSAGVVQQTPDGSLIEVNGAFFVDEGQGLGWYYDWGDGTQSTGFFPTIHRFPAPGDYTVVIKGFDDQGNVATFEFEHSVNAIAPTDVATVSLSAYSLALKEGESESVTVSALDDEGDPLSLAGRDVQIRRFISSRELSVVRSGVSIDVTVPVVGTDDSTMVLYYVSVDGVEAPKPLHVVVNKNSGEFMRLFGNRTVAFLPADFMSPADIPEQDYTTVFDLAFDAENDSVRNQWLSGEQIFQAISYAPAVHGLSGNPLLMGDSAKPAHSPNQLPYYWGIVFHEMGHNFHSIPTLFSFIGFPGAFYGETIAEWYVQFVLNRLLTRHSGMLNEETNEFLEELRQASRDYHEFEWQNYINGGKQFNYDQTGGGSHPLVQLIYTYSDEHGWDRLTTFMDQFDWSRMEAYAELISDHGGITTENRVTVMAAALAAVFGEDVSSDFEELNFPLNSDLYPLLRDLMIRLTVKIHPGMNDAWINPDAPFQGMFITVFFELDLIFLAWFTFDSVFPVNGDATLGAVDHRWITALGTINENKATLKAELTTGGKFNSDNPVATQDTTYGTIELEFSSCSTGTVDFNFPSAGESGSFEIERVLDNNVAICEILSDL